MARCSNRVATMLVIAGALLTTPAHARKTNQAVFEDPFDQAAGGSSLTRASQMGVMFANPALMPYGGKIRRWMGTQLNLIGNREMVAVAQGQIPSEEIPAHVIDHPVHVGVSFAASLIFSHFATGVFLRNELDLAGKRHLAYGPAGFQIEAEIYGGVPVSFATKLTHWLSVGITSKYMVVAEPRLQVDPSTLSQVAEDPSEIAESTGYGRGLSTDLGALLFLQGRHIDYRLALKIDDVGDTQFSGPQDHFRQTVHTGLGVTFHGTTEALHLSLDYRDIMGAYQEKPFKRLYAGARLLLRNRIGLAGGLYQGIPTAGIRVDLFLIQLGLTAYGREMGEYPGQDQRNLYVATIAFGF